MDISLLPPNQKKILKVLRSAMHILRMTEHFVIVGGLARYLAGDPKPPGDIDVLIEGPLCERYWEFFEILTLHGLKSVRDVLDRPSFPWQPFCSDIIAHAKALTINQPRGPDDERKDEALYICFKASNLEYIPRSHRWVDSLDPQLTGEAREQAIRAGRQRLINELQKNETWVSSPVLCTEIGLYYSLTR